MSVELGSIATIALSKKNAKGHVLSSLMKLGQDDKTFSDKLKNAVDKTGKDSKSVVLNLKKEISQVLSEARAQKNSALDEEVTGILHRQMISLANISSELQTEKDAKNLRESSKGDKKLSKLLESLKKDGMQADIKIQKLSENDIANEAKKTKKHDSHEPRSTSSFQKMLQIQA